MGKRNLKTLEPAEGRVVPLEDGSAWPTQNKNVKGEDVEVPKAIEVVMSRYFRRRLRDGDVVDINAKAETSKEEEAETKNDDLEKTSKASTSTNTKKGK